MRPENQPRQDLVSVARKALQEIKLRRDQEDALMRAMMATGIRDYQAGESIIERATRFFQEQVSEEDE